VIAQYIPPYYSKTWRCEDEFSRTRLSYLFRRGSRWPLSLLWTPKNRK